MTDNAYMQERAADVRDVSKRTTAHLPDKESPGPAVIGHETVAVACDLTPSDTAQLNGKYVKGFVTNIGGRTVHLAVMARSLGVPAVVGTKSIIKDVKDGDMLVADGLDGGAIANPADAQAEEHAKEGEAPTK